MKLLLEFNKYFLGYIIMILRIILLRRWKFEIKLLVDSIFFKVFRFWNRELFYCVF